MFRQGGGDDTLWAQAGEAVMQTKLQTTCNTALLPAESQVPSSMPKCLYGYVHTSMLHTVCIVLYMSDGNYFVLCYSCPKRDTPLQ